MRPRCPGTIQDARRLVAQLHADLKALTDVDQEQEVRGMAIPVLDASLTAIKGELPADDPVIASVQEVVSVDMIAAGEPIRAADAFIVAGQLMARLGPEPPPRARISRAPRPSWMTEGL